MERTLKKQITKVFKTVSEEQQINNQFKLTTNLFSKNSTVLLDIFENCFSPLARLENLPLILPWICQDKSPRSIVVFNTKDESSQVICETIIRSLVLCMMKTWIGVVYQLYKKCEHCGQIKLGGRSVCEDLSAGMFWDNQDVDPREGLLTESLRIFDTDKLKTLSRKGKVATDEIKGLVVLVEIKMQNCVFSAIRDSFNSDILFQASVFRMVATDTLSDQNDLITTVLVKEDNPILRELSEHELVQIKKN